MAARKLYSASHRKRMNNTGDPYLVKGISHHGAVCKGCHAVHKNKRWYMDEALFHESIKLKEADDILCPACRKIKDKYAGGIVRLRGSFIKDHEKEIMSLIKNEEKRAMGFNPLERIIKICKFAEGIEIITTNEKLAQRIGKTLQKTFKGNVEYKWSSDTKLLRADWER